MFDLLTELNEKLLLIREQKAIILAKPDSAKKDKQLVQLDFWIYKVISQIELFNKKAG